MVGIGELAPNAVSGNVFDGEVFFSIDGWKIS
jgi:hypothetical protein